MASLALTGASLWRAMSMRDRPAGCASCATRLCGALCGSGRPPRGGRRRSFVGGERLLVANGRCWRCRGSAPRRRRRAPATTGHRAAACDQHDTRRHTATSARQRARPTRHSPPHGDIRAAACAANTTLAATRRQPRGSVSGQHDTRRHTATSMLMIFAAAAAGRAARFSYGVLAKAWC